MKTLPQVLEGAFSCIMAGMRILQTVVVGVVMVTSIKSTVAQQTGGFSFAGSLQLIEDSGTEDLGDIGLALMVQKRRFQNRLATAQPYQRAIINRHFDDLTDLAFEKKRVYETYSGGVRAQEKMRLENWIRNIRSSIPMADHALWSLNLGGTAPAPAKAQVPLVFRYPQQPTLEPSWKRAQRLERAQLGSVGQPARDGIEDPAPKRNPSRKAPHAVPPKTEASDADAVPTIPRSVHSLAHVPLAELSANEGAYLAAVQEFVATTEEASVDISTLPSHNQARSLAATHTRLTEAWNKYLQLAATPRFAEIDKFVRQGMVSEMTAYQYADDGVWTGDWWTWKMSRVPHREGHALLAQARALLPTLPPAHS